MKLGIELIAASIGALLIFWVLFKTTLVDRILNRIVPARVVKAKSNLEIARALAEERKQALAQEIDLIANSLKTINKPNENRKARTTRRKAIEGEGSKAIRIPKPRKAQVSPPVVD